MSKDKRRLEPIGTYDPYLPRIYGDYGEIYKRRQGRELLDVVMTNEAFAVQKQREIAEKTRAIAERDADHIEATHRAERRARKVGQP